MGDPRGRGRGPTERGGGSMGRGTHGEEDSRGRGAGPARGGGRGTHGEREGEGDPREHIFTEIVRMIPNGTLSPAS